MPGLCRISRSRFQGRIGIPRLAADASTRHAAAPIMLTPLDLKLFRDLGRMKGRSWR
jgi:hypothetical protein